VEDVDVHHRGDIVEQLTDESIELGERAWMLADTEDATALHSAHGEHGFVDVAESMVMTDQLNAHSLPSAQLIARRWQPVKEAHCLVASASDYSSADYVMGWMSRKQGAIVLPPLAARVAATMRKEGTILKEAPNARDEMKLKRMNPKGTGRGATGADGE